MASALLVLSSGVPRQPEKPAVLSSSRGVSTAPVRIRNATALSSGNATADAIMLDDVQPNEHGHYCSDTGCWPAVYVLGGQKCGTTSVFGLFEKARLFCGRQYNAGEGELALVKEAHFWDKKEYFGGEWENVLGDMGALQNYLGGYSPDACRKGKYADATPSYLRDYNTASRMANTLPPSLVAEARFLAIFREPISRDISFYNMIRGSWVDQGSPATDYQPGHGLISANLCGTQIEQGIFPTYTEAVECELVKWKRCVHNAGGEWEAYRQCSLDTQFKKTFTGHTRLTDGMYVAQITRYSKVFPRQHILVLNFADMVAPDKSADFIARTLKFFGLPAMPELTSYPEENVHDYDGKVHLPDCETRDAMMQIFGDWNSQLYEQLSSDKSSGAAPEEEPDFSAFSDSDCEGNKAGKAAGASSAAHK